MQLWRSAALSDDVQLSDTAGVKSRGRDEKGKHGIRKGKCMNELRNNQHMTLDLCVCLFPRS